MYGVKYLQGAVAIFAGTAAALKWSLGFTLAQAIGVTSSITAYVLLGLFGSLLIYRLFFHPLRRFPGPFGAKVTSLWLTTKVTNHDAHKVSLELYRKYGPFVRVGSSDLMLAHPAAVQEVHGNRSKCRKATWYDEDLPRESMHTSRNHQFHAERRRVWSKAFGDRELRGYERRIGVYNKLLMDRLRESGSHAVDAAKWFNHFSFDVMGDLAFNHDFGMLAQGEQHWAVALLDTAMDIQSLKLPTWIFRMMIAIPGLTKDYWRFIGYCDEQLRLRMAEKGSDGMSLMAVLLDHAGENPSEQEMNTLRSDSRSIIVAGSDTTAATLSHIFYYLAANPQSLETLRNELIPLKSQGGTFEHQRIYDAPYLNAVINETLRLSPVPPTAITRKTPPEGIMVDNTFVPGNMTVWTPQYVISRLDRAYERPDEFLPQRWTEEPSMIKDKTAYAPFLAGESLLL